MAKKKAYSPKDIERIKTVELPFDGKWEEAFGCPSVNETWFITGQHLWRSRRQRYGLMIMGEGYRGN